MGFWNPRAFCPECGAKIHTRGGRTGRTCPMCGAALSRRTDAANVAVSVERAAWADEAQGAHRQLLRRMAVYWLRRGP